MMPCIQGINFCLVGALTAKPYSFSFRSWEIEYLAFFDFFDSLCASIFLGVRGLKIMRILPRLGFSEWISDKIRFCYDSFYNQRLFKPMVRENGFLCEVSWQFAFFLHFFFFNLVNYSFFFEKSVFDCFGGKFLESTVALSCSDFFYTSNVFSRFFFNFGELRFSYSHFDFLFNYSFFFESRQVIWKVFLLSLNLRMEMPYVYLQFIKVFKKGEVDIFVQGAFYSLPYSSFDFIGSEDEKFFYFLRGKSNLCLRFLDAEKILFLFGDSLFLKKNVGFFFKFFGAFKRFFEFFFSFGKEILFGFSSSNVSSVNVLELGVGCSKVESLFFCDFNKSVLYLLDFDEFVPDLKTIYGLIVFQGHHGDQGVGWADVVYPAATPVERRGLFLSIEGLVRRKGFNLRVPGVSRVDWRIFCSLSLFFSMKDSFFFFFFKFFDFLFRLKDFGFDFFFNILSFAFSLKRWWVSRLFFFFRGVYSSFIFDFFSQDCFSRASVSLLLASRKKQFFNFK